MSSLNQRCKRSSKEDFGCSCRVEPTQTLQVQRVAQLKLSWSNISIPGGKGGLLKYSGHLNEMPAPGPVPEFEHNKKMHRYLYRGATFAKRQISTY
ncbi:unnamed protein product [Allacma fusca]|uniref:Uncharacterized protein n=1 Tax=Allacma fusca TaxID=39272 RepID=A0A8J2LUX8_9HEXA|nr:unnamed protein product [Allacma fusca]